MQRSSRAPVLSATRSRDSCWIITLRPPRLPPASSAWTWTAVAARLGTLTALRARNVLALLLLFGRGGRCGLFCRRLRCLGFGCRRLGRFGRYFGSLLLGRRLDFRFGDRRGLVGRSFLGRRLFGPRL